MTRTTFGSTLAALCVALAACDSPTLERADGVSPLFAFCSSSGECGPDVEPPPPPPPPPPPVPTTAVYDYGTGVGSWGDDGNVEWLYLRSWSNGGAGVFTTSLESNYYWGHGCAPSTWNYYTTDSRTVINNGTYANVWFSRRFSHSVTREAAYRVNATHTFVPITGVSGGGTFKTWTIHCPEDYITPVSGTGGF